MSSRRVRIIAGLAVLVLLLGVVVLVTRDDGDDDSAQLDSGDETTMSTGPSTTTERPSTSTTSTSTTAPSTTTSPAAPTTTAPPPPADPFASARITLRLVVQLDQPIAMAVRPTDGSLWIARKGGSVCRLSGGSCGSSQSVASVSTGSEQGLLGIAFSPGGSRFYASYTDPGGTSRLDEFHVLSDGRADLATRRPIFSEPQPESNHNGGHITFGPDGRLYLGLGDGGGAGDQHGANGNGQDPGTDLGKILRIDPAGPTVQRWISGVRNPWRFSFDRAGGDLWVADVGQNAWEEVTWLPAGAQQGRNLGWRCFEGSHAFAGCAPAGGHTGPIHEYAHGPGCSITGGYVYRGTAIPALVGAYLYADYCDGQLRGFTRAGSTVRTHRSLGVDPGNVVSFGQAGNGELYVLTTGAVYRIDPA